MPIKNSLTEWIKIINLYSVYKESTSNIMIQVDSMYIYHANINEKKQEWLC